MKKYNICWKIERVDCNDRNPPVGLCLSHVNEQSMCCGIHLDWLRWEGFFQLSSNLQSKFALFCAFNSSVGHSLFPFAALVRSLQISLLSHCLVSVKFFSLRATIPLLGVLVRAGEGVVLLLGVDSFVGRRLALHFAKTMTATGVPGFDSVLPVEAKWHV